MTPLVSVVIVTCNRLSLLLRAIKSIDSQSYENIEILIVDNASDVPLRLTNFGTNIEIRIFTNEIRKSAAVNRNIGCKNSQGDIICFLDDDDYYFPEKIKEVVVALNSQSKPDFAFGRCDQIDGNGNLIVTSFGPCEIGSLLLYRYIHLNSLAVRKIIFNKLNFNEQMETYEDVEFVGRLVRDFKGVEIDSPHSVWIRDMRPDQLTKRNIPRSYRNWKILCDVFESQISNDKGLSGFYYKKMLILSLVTLNPVSFFLYFRRYMKSFFIR
jgi:glycosyltransferase involved in cell wall biosynthesis